MSEVIKVIANRGAKCIVNQDKQLECGVISLGDGSIVGRPSAALLSLLAEIAVFGTQR